jgi:hypothetical protein
MKLLGTDLLVGGVLNANQLAVALSAIFGVDHGDIYQSKLFDLEAETPSGCAYEAYSSAIGNRNVVLIHELPERGAVSFVVDVEFITPVRTHCLQQLADEFDLVIGLSGDTAYPEEVGTASGEGYVLFRRSEHPVFAWLVENQDVGQTVFWEILDRSLPPLPTFLLPEARRFVSPIKG